MSYDTIESESRARSLVDLTGIDTENEEACLHGGQTNELVAATSFTHIGDDWQCQMCTLLNDSSANVCQACGNAALQAANEVPVVPTCTLDADDAEIERRAGFGNSDSMPALTAGEMGQQVYDPWKFHHNYLSPNQWPRPEANPPGECVPFWSLFNVDLQPRVLTENLVLTKSRPKANSATSLPELPAEAILSSYGMERTGLLLPLLQSGLHTHLVTPYDHNQQTPHIDSDGIWLDLDEDEESSSKNPVRLHHFPNAVSICPPMLNHMLAAKYRPHIKRTKEARIDRAVWTTGPVATTMHTKLILIRFAHSAGDANNWMHTSRVRVVVTSANTSRYDWYCLDQNIWMQDFFPPTSASSCQAKPFATDSSAPSGKHLVQDVYISPTIGDFKRQLHLVLEAFMIPPATIQRCLAVSFHDAFVDLVASIPGIHKATSYERWLQAGPPSASTSLASAAQQVGEDPETNVMANVGINRLQTLHRHYLRALDHLHCPLHAMPRKLLFQMSSVGALSQSFLWSLASACLGRNIDGGGPPPKPPAGSGTKRKREEATAQAPITLLWPSFAHANGTKFRSASGAAYGATHLMLSSHTWKRAGFPRSNFSDYSLMAAMAQPRAANLSHCKLLYPEQRPDAASTPAQIVRMWLYAGSANASMAAWGSRQLSDTQLRLGNHELGVLFPPVVHVRMSIPFAALDNGAAIAWVRQHLESSGFPEAQSAGLLIGKAPSRFPLYYEPVLSPASGYHPWLYPEADDTGHGESDSS
jgi:rubredoxin